MQLRNGKRKLDAYRPTFDPGLDIATVVFSHVRCVKTRVNLTLVSKLWRDASKTAAAYPLRFDFDAFPDIYIYNGDLKWSRPGWSWRYLSYLDMRRLLIIRLLDNDEALSLPCERVVGLLGEAAEHVCEYAAIRGCVKLLKWMRENNHDWSTHTCCCAASNGHLPVLQYLHENGCPWGMYTCMYAFYRKHWDCLQYAVDNKAPYWEWYAEKYANHLR